ncbi:allantoicase-like [Daphnia pulex]|uniref:allantoicase-like n=1 Tax=Daphnia pulex TaxID=6669 RepID=UPI001EDCA82F|nr:allantoicase-like [Daphnia pulex]
MNEKPDEKSESLKKDTRVPPVQDFLSKPDLTACKNGGKILFATDDGFAVAENLLKETKPEWREGVYTDYGKWMDGWESRRKRVAGHDWCIIKLGIPGCIHGFDVDTSYFVGNYPPKMSIQAAVLPLEQEEKLPVRRSHIGNQAYLDEMVTVNAMHSELWEELVPMSELKPGTPETCHNYFNSLNIKDRFTHIRFNLYPDGGVARLHVYGTPKFDWTTVPASEVCITRVDLVALANGGECMGFSDAHFGNPKNLISPGRGTGMYDGWETARRLDRPSILEEDVNGHLLVTGKEWACFRLGHSGIVTAVEVDTHHFKCNFPDYCLLEGCYAPPGEEEKIMKMEGEPWKTILSNQKLLPNKPHYFSGASIIHPHGTVNLIRLIMAPDGGISRLRVWGHIRSYNNDGSVGY